MYPQPEGHYLAQINVSVSRYDLDDSRFEGFTRRIDAVNAIAERADGFVWRLKPACPAVRWIVGHQRIPAI